VRAEVLPTSAPDSAEGEVALGLRLNEIVADIGRHRGLPLTRGEAIDARKVARDALKAGWPAELIAKALAEVRAFTPRALTYAISRLRDEHHPRPVPPDRMSAAERSAEVLRKAIRGES
jgi:hypothetical protein